MVKGRHRFQVLNGMELFAEDLAEVPCTLEPRIYRTWGKSNCAYEVTYIHI